MRELLAAGASVNATKDDGWTPLHVAAMNGKAISIDHILDI